MLQAQTQKQQDAQAQLRSYVDAEIKAMHDRVSAQLRDSQLGLKTGLDAANRSLQDVKDALRYWSAFDPAAGDALVWQIRTFNYAAQRAAQRVQGTRDRAVALQPGKAPADLLLLMLLAHDRPSLSKRKS